MVKLTALGLLAALFFSTTSYGNGLEFGTPVLGGTGCPEGSAIAVLSGNNEIVINFDHMIAEAGVNKPMDRKTCSIAIPVHIPQGLMIAFEGIKLQGSAFLPKKSNAIVKAELFFAGSRSAIISKTISGKKDTNIEFDSGISAKELAWSACGSETIIRLNISALVSTNKRKDMAIVALDNAVASRLVLRSCSN